MKARGRRRGAMKSFRFDSEMQLHIADFVPAEDITQRFETAKRVLRFYFHILASGHWELKSPYRCPSQEIVPHSNSFSSVLFYPEMEGELYGTTVFGYLRQRRLIEAKRLIEEEQMSVTEAALSVGYNSVSSFTVASETMQIFGGYGIGKEYPVEKMFRDARVGMIGEENNALSLAGASFF